MPNTVIRRKETELITFAAKLDQTKNILNVVFYMCDRFAWQHFNILPRNRPTDPKIS